MNDNRELSEKNFIQDEINKVPPKDFFWLYYLLLIGMFALFIGGYFWYGITNKEDIAEKPFLEVSNRDFSLFLWQFPGYMRSNVSSKTGYLPAFKSFGTSSVDPRKADDIVAAPPELLFLYHTWSRLLSQDYIPRPIPTKEFISFLKDDQQWSPEFWKQAPVEYNQLVNKLSTISEKDLQVLPETTLPLVVRKAFQGWKNYYDEGGDINAYKPAYKELKAFLSKYPHYARNYWQNIQYVEKQQVAGDSYLQTYTLEGGGVPDDVVPNAQVGSFLRVALYNVYKAENKQ